MLRLVVPMAFSCVLVLASLAAWGGKVPEHRNRAFENTWPFQDGLDGEHEPSLLNPDWPQLDYRGWRVGGDLFDDTGQVPAAAFGGLVGFQFQSLPGARTPSAEARQALQAATDRLSGSFDELWQGWRGLGACRKAPLPPLAYMCVDGWPTVDSSKGWFPSGRGSPPDCAPPTPSRELATRPPEGTVLVVAEVMVKSCRDGKPLWEAPPDAEAASLAFRVVLVASTAETVDSGKAGIGASHYGVTDGACDEDALAAEDPSYDPRQLSVEDRLDAVFRWVMGNGLAALERYPDWPGR